MNPVSLSPKISADDFTYPPPPVYTPKPLPSDCPQVGQLVWFRTLVEQRWYPAVVMHMERDSTDVDIDIFATVFLGFQLKLVDHAFWASGRIEDFANNFWRRSANQQKIVFMSNEVKQSIEFYCDSNIMPRPQNWLGWAAKYWNGKDKVRSCYMSREIFEPLWQGDQPDKLANCIYGSHMDSKRRLEQEKQKKMYQSLIQRPSISPTDRNCNEISSNLGARTASFETVRKAIDTALPNVPNYDMIWSQQTSVSGINQQKQIPTLPLPMSSQISADSDKRGNAGSDSLQSTEIRSKKKRCVTSSHSDLIIPLNKGFRREVSLRNDDAKIKRGDVYYHTPENTYLMTDKRTFLRRLRSGPEVLRYLDQNSGNPLLVGLEGGKHFSFNAEVTLEHEKEWRHPAAGKKAVKFE